MPMAERTATSVWKGNLTEGSGEVNVASGALPQFPVTWASRTEQPDGKTSPEELIAAAHASCLSMAVSHRLAQEGHAPDRLEVQCTVVLERVNDKPTVTTAEVRVRGRVPGIDRKAFDQAVREAGMDCPISRALRGSIDIRIAEVALEQ